MTCPTAVKGRAPAAQGNTCCATRRTYYSGAWLSYYYLFPPVTSHPAFFCLSFLIFIHCI
ncbi:hypothetical protein DMZ73_24375 [Salmonella enterica subsp. enterica serovar Inganda]|nr:hypothetical protein [Salmonella enterica subsp. enterica serovar Inganda]ECH8971013.1 hypothetical protein [Salmonella enterica subsp. enterica]EDU9603737.1 hypothetical protein [Salmonella enterica subsp. enterica]